MSSLSTLVTEDQSSFTWIYPGKCLQRHKPDTRTGLAFHRCTPLSFLEQRTGSCEHSLLFNPSLFLASAMTQNTQSHLAPAASSGWDPDKTIHTVHLGENSPSFYQTRGLSDYSPYSATTALAAKGVFQDRENQQSKEQTVRNSSAICKLQCARDLKANNITCK